MPKSEQTGTERSPNVVLLPRKGVQYGVFKADKRLLGVWNTRAQAESFVYADTGRYVMELDDPYSDSPVK